VDDELGVDPAADRVNLALPEADLDPSIPLIADSENRLRIGDNNQIGLFEARGAVFDLRVDFSGS
jgi:hypothetical protein